jgi:hypothetical protein
MYVLLYNPVVFLSSQPCTNAFVLKFAAQQKSANFRELGIMPSSQKFRSFGSQANIHAASRNEGSFELGIMLMIPNHRLAINLIPT